MISSLPVFNWETRSGMHFATVALSIKYRSSLATKWLIRCEEKKAHERTGYTTSLIAFHCPEMPCWLKCCWPTGHCFSLRLFDPSNPRKWLRNNITLRLITGLLLDAMSLQDIDDDGFPQLPFIFIHNFLFIFQQFSLRIVAYGNVTLKHRFSYDHWS